MSADGRPELTEPEHDPALSTDDRRPTLTDTAPPPALPSGSRTAADLLPPRLRPRVDLAAVATRYRRALSLPARAGVGQLYVAALDSALDVPRLVSEVDRLSRTLVRSRLQYANLAAAARATLAATEDGDPDPFGYLRDELTRPTPTDPTPPDPIRLPRRPRPPVPPLGAAGGLRGRR